MDICGSQKSTMNARKFRQLLIHLDAPDVVNPPMWCTLQDKTNAKDYLQQLSFFFSWRKRLKNILIGMCSPYRNTRKITEKGKDWQPPRLRDIWTVPMRWTAPIRGSRQDRANSEDYCSSGCFRLWRVPSLFSEPLGGVKNLQVTDPTTNSLRVRWEPAEGDVRQYQIIYVPTTGGTEIMVGFLWEKNNNNENICFYTC